MSNNMEKVLFIDDFVTKQDIPIVIDYFIKFGIATVQNVEFTLHPESEYNAAYTDEYPNIYGSLIIYIKDWFSTQTAINFYERLTLNTCKIVYDDPDYFNVYLYSKYFDLDYLDDDNQLFLNDKVFLINRSTLELEHSGLIQAIKENVVTIKVKSTYAVHFQKEEYHVFIKRRKSKKNDREFYKALLDAL